MDKETLKKKTVAELKEMAKEIPDVKGLSSMKKDDLVELLAKQSKQSKPAKPAKPAKQAKQVGPSDTPKAKAKPAKKAAETETTGPLDKSEIKRRIRALKEEKREALSKQDRAKSKECNRQIHRYKRKLRKLTRGK